MTNKSLIAKPVVKNQFWIVTDGNEKVGNVLAEGSGFAVKLNGSKTHFENTRAIERIANIKFENVTKHKTPHVDHFAEYPTTKKVYNSILDVKRKLHLFTKTQKSKCYYTAGWFLLQQGDELNPVLCPKYIFIQRYSYQGPFKTKAEAIESINKNG
jgi:hypothetical protein